VWDDPTAAFFDGIGGAPRSTHDDPRPPRMQQVAQTLGLFHPRAAAQMNLHRAARNAVDRLREPQLHREPEPFGLVIDDWFDHARPETRIV
jgi:hypothetical protein